MRSNIFIKTLALISLLTSTIAWPVENNDIQIRSALDQNSNRGIILLASAEENPTNKKQENANKTPKPVTSDTSEPVERNGVVSQKPHTTKRSAAAKQSSEKAVPQQNAAVTADPQAIITEQDKAGSNKTPEIETRFEQLEQQITKLQNLLVMQQNNDKTAEQTALPTDQRKAVLQRYYLPTTAFITGILSLLGWQKWRKRKLKETSISESLFMATESSPPSKPINTSPIPPMKTEAPLKFLAELNILNANRSAVNLLAETGKLNEQPFRNNITDTVKVIIPAPPLLTTHKRSLSEQRQQELNERIAQETIYDELEFNFDFSEPLSTSNERKH
jgi:hypothetical protein